MRTFIVPPDFDGKPLERAVLQAFPGLSWGRVREALRKKDIRIDGRRIRDSVAVHTGQTVALYLPEEDFVPRHRIQTLFRDDAFLLVHKPRGLPVQSTSSGEDSLETLLRKDPADIYPAACHRLDAQTAGLVLFALTPQARTAALDAFRQHRIHKHYLCFTAHAPDPKRGQLRHYLLKDPENAYVRAVDRPVSGARHALLSYETLHTADAGALIHVQLYTGRTHQIRVQLSRIGCPLLGDDRYGDRALNRELHLRTQALWACALYFEDDLPGPLHSLSGRWFYAPLEAWRYPAVPGLSMPAPERIHEIVPNMLFSKD